MSLATRIALVLGIVVIAASLSSAGVIYWRLNDQLVQSEFEKLERETAIRTQYFDAQIKELIRDVKALSGMPPIQGIIRARDNGGVDPLDGSTLEVWKQRLAPIFGNILNSKLAYVQIRYIGLEDGGRELVRVDRLGDGSVQVVPPGNLQQKGTSDYFLETISLPPGEVYLSSINLNREYGRIQAPNLPVLRAAVPVYSAEGKVFGIVVINYGLSALFEQVTRDVSPGQVYYLSNGRGSFLVHPDKARQFDFEFGKVFLATREFPMLVHLQSADRDYISEAQTDKRRVVSARTLQYGPDRREHRIVLLVTGAYDAITAVSDRVLQQAATVLVLLLVIALLPGIWLARVATRPIRDLAAAVRDIDVQTQEWVHPAGLSAESEDLAKALDTAFEALHEHAAEIEKNNRELKQFLYIASHGLQETVRTVNTYVSLLDEAYRDSMDEQGGMYLHYIVESCKRMHLLIHGLLEYGRLGNRSHPERVDLNHLLQEVRSDMQSTIQERNALVEVAELPTLNVYKLEMRLLFQNLIGNAIKFVKSGMRPVIRVDCRCDGNLWEFSVTDNGIGIAPEQREKIFVIFQRLHGRNEYDGTGIGLAHCSKVAALHRGRIWVEDGRAGGSVFKFTIREMFHEE